MHTFNVSAPQIKEAERFSLPNVKVKEKLAAPPLRPCLPLLCVAKVDCFKNLQRELNLNQQSLHFILT